MKLAPAFVKLAPHVGKRLFGVLKLGLRLVKLFLPRADLLLIHGGDLPLPCPGPLFRQGEDGFPHGLHRRAVGAGVAVGRGVLHVQAQLHERAVQALKIEALPRHQEIRGLGQLKADVVRVAEKAGDGERCAV